MKTRKLGFLLSFAFFIFSSFLPLDALAFDNPQEYYDWNRYAPVSDQVLGLEVNAQEDAAAESPQGDHKDYKKHDYLLSFVSDLTPRNPFYFIKKVEEGLTSLVTFNTEDKDRLRLEFAGERLKEIEQVLASPNPVSVSGLANNYNRLLTTIANDLTELKNSGADVETLSEEVDLEAAKHKLVLEEVAIQVPENIEDGVNKALTASEFAVDTVADVKGLPAVPEEVVTRLQSLKAQGLLSEEEVAKLIASPTRQNARTELRKYVDANLIPPSDFLKFDETARNKFPQGFYTALEIRKFKELKDLETQKPDDATLARVQEFANNYNPGDTIPADLRRWWVPMVRLEELQNTIRPDLIPQDYFRNRPNDLQKYQEVIERVKPTKEDAQYVENLIRGNPNLLNDPSYARVKAFADKFGSNDAPPPSQQPNSITCGISSHWVGVPYMPNGGYCVPNYQYPATGDSQETPCAAGYHRNYPGGACYADSAARVGVGGINTAPGSCPAGYGWTTGSSGGGYCAPRTITDGGSFPSPIYTPGYCLPGQMFRDGKCETYNPPPSGGCGSGSWWNGTSCITARQCAQGEYQNSNGECVRSTGGDGRNIQCQPSNCPSGWYWNQSACSCNPNPGTRPPAEGTPGCTQPAGGCPSGWIWVSSACSCNHTDGSSGNYVPPFSRSGPSNCGSGYSWNGNYCAPSGSSQPQGLQPNNSQPNNNPQPQGPPPPSQPEQPQPQQPALPPPPADNPPPPPPQP